MFLGFSHLASNCCLGAKIFWGIMIVASWGAVGYYNWAIKNKITQEKKVFSSATYEIGRELKLPDITICAANPFQGYLQNGSRRAKCKIKKYSTVY